MGRGDAWQKEGGRRGIEEGKMCPEEANPLTSTLVHKNSKLSEFLTWLSLFTSTQFLEHIPTDDGITDGIPGSIDFGTNTGGIN